MKARTLACALLGLLAAAALAQESRGIIVGRVTDQAHSVIPGASVVLANLETV